MNLFVKHFLFLTLLFAVQHTVFAQKIDIKVQVTDDLDLPAPDLSFFLINLNNTDTLKSITDTLGDAALEHIDTTNTYQLIINDSRYKFINSSLTFGQNKNVLNIHLTSKDAKTNAVVITAQKPLFQQEEDKTIVNVAQLAESSTNGYEILEKTPSIFVDPDGNIYLSSTTPAKVYINGRELKMSQNEIATLLKSLPPNTIEKIEIIRTPSAKYDATAAGGIVNVVLKKGVKIGLTGSFNASWQQGKYGNQTIGASISNHDDKNTVYANASYLKRNKYERITSNRFYGTDSLLNQNAYTTYPGQSLFIGYGIAHTFDSSNDISYDGRITLDQSKSDADNKNNFLESYPLAPIANSLNNTFANNKSLLINQTINYKKVLDTLGSEWTTILDYTYAKGKNSQNYTNQIIYPIQADGYDGFGTTKSSRNALIFQTDLTLKLPFKISLEAGLKGSYLHFKNNADYATLYNSIQAEDTTRTNHFKYNEAISAAYIQASKTFGGFVIKAGLRMENTYMKGVQVYPNDANFTIKRTDFFPYLYLSQHIMKVADFDVRAYVISRRTITRPSYDQLNPSPQYIDQFLSQVGNPNLKPQFTQNYEANISVKEWPVAAMGINKNTDVFTNVFYQPNNANGIAYRTYDNLGKNNEFYMRGFAGLPPGGKYFFIVGGQMNRSHYEGLYEGKPLDFIGTSWLFYSYHQLKIDPYSVITVNGWVRLKGPLQFYEIDPLGTLNISINRTFFNQKLTVTISGQDLLWTNKPKFTIQQGNVHANGSRVNDTRRIGVNFKYDFGMVKQKNESMEIFQSAANGKTN